MSDPLPIGKKVAYYGTIEAVVFTGGERYYMLNSWRGVSFIPGHVIEPFTDQFDAASNGEKKP